MESQNCHVIGNAALTGRTFNTMAEAYQANGGHVGLRMGPAPAVAAALTVETVNPFVVGDRVILADDPTPEVLTDMKRGRVTDVDDDWCVVSWDSGTSGGYRPVKLSTAPLPGGEPLPSLQSTPDTPDRVAGPVAVAEPLPVYAQPVRTDSEVAVADARYLHEASLYFDNPSKLWRYSDGHTEDLTASRQAFDALPTLSEALAQTIATIEAEQRDSIVVSSESIRMDDSGQLVVCGHPNLSLEAVGFARLVGRFGSVLPKGRALLELLDSELRAQVWNTQIARLRESNQTRILTRLTPTGERVVWGAVSGSYTPVDGDQTCAILRRALGGQGFRGDVTYDRETSNLVVDAVLHDEVRPDAKAGEVHKVAVRVKSNDVGGGSIRGDAMAFRPMCLNMAFIQSANRPLFRVRHSGNEWNMRRRIREGAQLGPAIFSGFMDRWGVLASAPASAVLDMVPARLDDDGQPVARTDDAAGWFDALTEMRMDVGVRRDSLVEMLLATYSEEPGDTVADLVNAVTRVHTLDSIDVYQRERFERAASDLVPVLAHRIAQA